jgi:amino acid efflux transporter
MCPENPATTPGRQGAGGAPEDLRKAIGPWGAVALYVSSVVGPGILALPGLTAEIAGPGSIFAWIILSAASYPFAYTFSTLSARRPQSGGVFRIAADAFGYRVATVTGWLMTFFVVIGAVAVALIAASYLGYALQLSRPEDFAVAVLVSVSAYVVNLRGVEFSVKVQFAIVGSIIAILITTVLTSGWGVRSASFTPVLPNGLSAVGAAIALGFFAYLGYENVSNVAGEFRDPVRDYRRSATISVVIVGVMFTSVAIVTVGTRAYLVGGGVAPFAVMMARLWGPYGSLGAAVLAMVLVVGVVNANTLGVSRVVQSVAKAGGFPAGLAPLSERSKTPDRALTAVFSCTLVAFAVFYFTGTSVASALLVSSGAGVLVYVIGSAAGVRILGSAARSRSDRAFPLIALLVSLAVLPFVGLALVGGAAAAAGGLIFASWNLRSPLSRRVERKN